MTPLAPSARKRFDLSRLRPRRHEYDRDVARPRTFAQSRQRRRSVHSGHHDVEQHEIGRPVAGDGDRISPGGATADRQFRIETERNFDHLADVRLVIDDKHTKRSHATSSIVGASEGLFITIRRRIATRLPIEARDLVSAANTSGRRFRSILSREDDDGESGRPICVV